MGKLDKQRTELELSAKEQAMLAGDLGPGVRKAIEIVVALGRIFGARRLVSVGSVQVAGVSYHNLGEAGLEFLREWADQDARVRVPTTLNPAGMDLRAWRELGFSESFAESQFAVIKAFQRLGVRTTCTCTPYLVGNVPRPGEHVAWAESSAVSYANSVLGARTNREGGPSALAAAVTGRTAAYGLHLDESRRAALRVDVRCPVRTLSDFGALGYLVGKVARNRVPYFVGLGAGLPRPYLKALGAAMAASGAVALYHVEGVTPEAAGALPLHRELPRIAVDDLSDAHDALNSPMNEVDFVSLGCPHSTLGDIERVTQLLEGKRVKATLWITTSRHVRERARRMGWVSQIEKAGAKVFADTCLVVAPIEKLGFRSMATNSAKAAFYGPSHAKLERRFGTMEQCIEAALSGRWVRVTDSDGP